MVANALGSMALFCVILMGGFVLVKDNIHPWTCVILLPVAAPALSRSLVCKTTSAGLCFCHIPACQRTPAIRTLTLSAAVASRNICLSRHRQSLSNKMPTS